MKEPSSVGDEEKGAEGEATNEEGKAVKRKGGCCG